MTLQEEYDAKLATLKVTPKKPRGAKKGEKHWAAKLSEEKIAQMKEMYFKKEMSYEKIGTLFGVKRFAVSRAINGRTYNG